MATYVIYNRKTGEPVQTHIEPDGMASSRDDLLKKVQGSPGRVPLEVVVVSEEQIRTGKPDRIEAGSGALKVKSGAGAAFGGGGLDVPGRASLRRLRRVYEREADREGGSEK